MKRGLCIILSMILSVSVSGCWSRKEPKTLALVNSAIYDLSGADGYQVTIEVINPSAEGDTKDGGSGKSPNITAISEGSSLPEAIRNISESLDRTIFGGHNKVRFFSERFAQKDITAIMDYLLRDHLTDENPLMVVIRGNDPQQVYSCMIGLSETVGDYLDSMSETQPNTTSKSVFVKTLDFIKDYYDEGKQPVAGVVELVECESKPSNNTFTDTYNARGLQNPQGSSDKKYRMVYKGLAAFKGNKLAGYMDELEARAYNFITNNIERAVISIVSENSKTVVIVHNPKTEIKTGIKNGQITVNVKIKTPMSIIQESGTMDISKMEPLKAVEAAFNKQMAGEITVAIQKAQTDFQSDIFGFGVSVHKQHPEKWKEIKGNWDDYFSKAMINVSVESTVDRSGEIKRPFGLEAE
jgi:spore germination protein KC